jgi:hypothetical protein
MDTINRLRICIALSLLTLSLSLHAQQSPATNCGSANCAAAAEPQHTDGEQAVAIVNEFLARHKDFTPCQQNAIAMSAYLKAHNLDPLAESSFEKAFDDLRHRGQLKISSK